MSAKKYKATIVFTAKEHVALNELLCSISYEIVKWNYKPLKYGKRCYERGIKMLEKIVDISEEVICKP